MLYLRQMIKRCANNYPTKVAYHCGDHKATWKQMDERSDRFAAACLLYTSDAADE